MLRDAGVGPSGPASLSPCPGSRTGVETVTSFEDVKLLTVRLSRLRRWYADGLLIIGDAAHAMSPVGGVGINLAIQDAVAAGEIVGPKLAGRTLTRATLRRVQLRRWALIALTEALQQAAHRVLQARLASAGTEQAAATSLPLPARLLRRFPLLRAIPALLVGLGALPQHAPRWAMPQVSKTRRSDHDAANRTSCR